MIIDGTECIIRLRAVEEVLDDSLDKELLFKDMDEAHEFFRAHSVWARGCTYSHEKNELGEEMLKVVVDSYVRDEVRFEGDFEIFNEVNEAIASHPNEEWKAYYWILAKDGSDEDRIDDFFWAWTKWQPLCVEACVDAVEDYRAARGLKSMMFEGKKHALRVFFEKYDGTLVAEKVFEDFDAYKTYTDEGDPDVFVGYGDVLAHCSVVELINGEPAASPLTVFVSDFITMRGISDSFDAKLIVKDYLAARLALEERCEQIIEQDLIDRLEADDAADMIKQLVMSLEVRGYRVEEVGQITWEEGYGIRFAENYSFGAPLPDGMGFSKAFKMIVIPNDDLVPDDRFEVDNAFASLLAWSESLPDRAA